MPKRRSRKGGGSRGNQYLAASLYRTNQRLLIQQGRKIHELAVREFALLGDNEFHHLRAPARKGISREKARKLKQAEDFLRASLLRVHRQVNTEARL